MKSFHITIPIYYDRIDFCITENKNEAREYVNKHFKIDVGEKSDNVNGYCVSSDSCVIIWLPRIPTKSSEFGALHHEIYHAVKFLLSKKGVTDFDESCAYLLGYVADVFYNIYEPIRRHDFKIFGKKIWIESCRFK